MPDYIAMRLEEEKDAKQYGVKGQRWGVRRSSRELSAAAKVNPPVKQVEAKKTAAASNTPAKKPAGDIQKVESAPDRYSRLAAQAKDGRAKEMSAEDLKFFNARTEALKKVEALNETKPGWLRETTVKVIQQSAQRQMQGVADAIADKYISDPIKAALKGVADTAAVASAAKATTPKATTAKKTVDTAAVTPSSSTKTSATPSTTSTAPRHRASLSDRAKETAQRAADSVAASKRAKGDKQYEQTQKQIADIDAAKAKNPRLLNVTESVKYFTDNPTATPEPPVGLTANGVRLWLEEIQRARGN